MHLLEKVLPQDYTKLKWHIEQILQFANNCFSNSHRHSTVPIFALNGPWSGVVVMSQLHLIEIELLNPILFNKLFNSTSPASSFVIVL